MLYTYAWHVREIDKEPTTNACIFAKYSFKAFCARCKRARSRRRLLCTKLHIARTGTYEFQAGLAFVVVVVMNVNLPVWADVGCVMCGVDLNRQNTHPIC